MNTDYETLLKLSEDYYEQWGLLNTTANHEEKELRNLQHKIVDDIAELIKLLKERD